MTALPTQRRARRPLIARVEETQQLSPHLIRVVVAGDDLAGFGAGAFTDHYVKLQLPPSGRPTRRRSTSRTSAPGCRASSGPAPARTPCGRGIRTAAG